MPRRLFLGLDVGTQSTKGLLLDADTGDVISRAHHAYGLVPDVPTGAAEQHPSTWIDAVSDVIRQLLDDSNSIDEIHGIGVSGQQHGLVVLDDDDNVIRPAKLWCDTSTATEADELTVRWGRAVPTGFTASKVLWMQRHEPDHWKRVRRVLLPHDYVNFMLTSRAVMEPGDASGTGWFDVESGTFDTRAVEDLDLVDRLPPLIASSELAGTLSASAARRFGLRTGTPVASGGGDNMMSAIGSGATAPGVVVVSLGTSGTAFAYSSEPIIDPDGLIATFRDSTGGWLPLLCVMNMTGVSEEIRIAFDVDHATLTREAANVPPGCDGLTMLPYLVGERVPNLPSATGALIGLRPGTFRRGPLYRAALEGTTLNLGLGVDRMRRLGLTVDAVRVVGGGSNNPLWRQILADVLGVPVVRLIEPESAALGAAIQAVWAVERRDDSSLRASDVAARFVKVDDDATACTPSTTTVPVYERLRRQFEERTRRIF